MSEAESTNRRIGVRFLPVPGTSRAQIAEEDHIIPQRAAIRNVSLTGIGLLVDGEFAPGTNVEVILHHPTDPVSKSYSARVTRCQRQPDGRSLLGCSFAEPLSDEALWEFLAGIE